MKAVGHRIAGSIDREDALLDITLPEPVAAGRDLLVEVRAVSVNPIDTKVRSGAYPVQGDWKVLGWDAAGIVRAAGPDATLFRPGDAVFYAGALDRPGTNAELHLVDERIVGRKPRSLDWAEAAALPLTSLTAWEALFDRLDVARPVSGGAPAILVIGGAGGVGSIAIQIARRRTGLAVIATGSRPETREWVEELGAQHVLDHSEPLAPQMEALGIGAPSFVFSTTHTDRHVADIVELIAPQGRFCLIDDPAGFDIMPFKRKSVSIHHELMFTRSLYATPDIGEQGRILDDIASLVDAGEIRSTLNRRLAPINAANLRQAHVLLESATTKGKIVLEGL